MRRWFWIFVMAFLLMGCSQRNQKKEKVFTMGTEEFSKGIDPSNEWDGWYTMRYGIGETLFSLDENLHPQPWLASGYRAISANIWEIDLKSGIVFSDGDTLTPQMVVKNFEHIAKKNKRAKFLENASYEIFGNTIRITMAQPRASLIGDLADPYACMIDLDHSDENHIVGSGPYICEEFVADRHIILRPNPYYWDGKPKMDKVVVKKVFDKETGAMALDNGELDAFVALNEQSYRIFENLKKYHAQSIETSRLYAVYYNPETVEKSLREAIHLAINKEEMAQYLFYKNMTPTNTPFPDSTGFGDSEVKIAKYDVERAREILEQSGYRDEDGDGYLEKDGKKVQLHIHYYQRLSNEQVATQLITSLRNIGIFADITKNMDASYLKNGNYDLGLYTVVTLPKGDPQSFLEDVMSKEGVSNFNHFSDSRADELLNQFLTATGQQERTEIARQLVQIYSDAYYMECIGFAHSNAVTKKNVQGFILSPSQYRQISVDLDKGGE